MATNIVKSVKYETYESKFSGMVTINLANEVDGNVITEDGVFEVGKTKKIRVNVSYLMAVIRNHDVHGVALSIWLDALKVKSLPLRQASWSRLLINQEIDVESVLQDADEDHANEWYSHEIKLVTIPKSTLLGAYRTMVLLDNPLLEDVEVIDKEAKKMMAEFESYAEE
jgi:hypothetical protein